MRSLLSFMNISIKQFVCVRDFYWKVVMWMRKKTKKVQEFITWMYIIFGFHKYFMVTKYPNSFTNSLSIHTILSFLELVIGFLHWHLIDLFSQFIQSIAIAQMQNISSLHIIGLYSKSANRYFELSSFISFQKVY